MALKLIGSYLDGRMQCEVERRGEEAMIKSDTSWVKKGTPRIHFGATSVILYRNEIPSLTKDKF